MDRPFNFNKARLAKVSGKVNKNLPDRLSVCISLNKEKIWKKESPLSLTKAKLKSVKGNVSKIFPPTANKIANIIKINIVNNLVPFVIFLAGIFAHHFNKK